MLRVFRTSDDGTLEKLKNIETNTWIDLVEPTEEEILFKNVLFDNE